MGLSKRELYIAVATVLAVLILAVDHYALTPFLESREIQQAERALLTEDLQKAAALFRRQGLYRKKWRRMVETGMRREPAEAESAVYHALQEWSKKSGLALASVKPVKVAARGDLVEISFQVAGAGRMAQAARFLWMVETAALPLRIEQLQIGSRKDGADDLSLQLKLSSICLPPSLAGGKTGKGKR